MRKIQKNKQQTLKSQKKPEQLTFLDHLYELRSRLFWVIGTLIVTSSIGFQFKDLLVGFIMAPLNGQKLVYLTPGGGFSFIFTLCLYFGALIAIPVVVYHLYRFLQPVMGKARHQLLAVLMLLSALLALIGATFGYFVAIPAAITFLTGFAGEAVTANLTAESYLNFIMAYMFGLALLFQLPLVIVMIDHVRRFPPGTLLSSQRFVIVGAFISAAIITPTPDLVNQMIIAIPIVVVYQLGVVAVYLRHKRHQIEDFQQVVQERSIAIKEEIVPKVAIVPQPEVRPASIVTVSEPLVRSSGFMRQHAVAPSLPPRRSIVMSTPTSNFMPRQHRRLRSIDGLSIVKHA